MSERVDYTKLRKGSIHNGHQIEVCPKCGRKGLAYHYKRADNLTWDTTIKHGGYAEQMGGFTFTTIDDYCTL